MAGHIFTPNPTGFVVAGTTVSAGGPAISINGTVISLQPSGTLVLGSMTIPVLKSPTPSPADMTLDGFDIQLQSSLVIVDGITVSAAATGVTVSGESFSLEAGGKTLDLGTRRFALPTGAGGSLGVQAFLGGQNKAMQVPWGFVRCACGAVALLSLLPVMS